MCVCVCRGESGRLNGNKWVVVCLSIFLPAAAGRLQSCDPPGRQEERGGGKGRREQTLVFPSAARIKVSVMEALNPEIKSEQVQQPELLEPNDSRAAPPPLLLLLLRLRLLLNVKTESAITNHDINNERLQDKNNSV